MKALVFGVKRIKGTARASGNAFDMTRVIIGSPIVPQDGEKMTVQGFGYEVTEVPMEETALAQFRGIKFPAVLELVTDSRPYRGKLELLVTGLLVADKAAA